MNESHLLGGNGAGDTGQGQRCQNYGRSSTLEIHYQSLMKTV